MLMLTHFTGAAGVGGALVFTALSTFLDTRVSILIQLVMPLVMLLRYIYSVLYSHDINNFAQCHVVICLF